MNLFQTLESFSWEFGALVIVTLFVAFAISGVVIIRKVVNQKTLKAHHDVAGVVFANIGVLYSVLLGFTVVNVQQRFDKIKEISYVEASYLAKLYRDSEVFLEKDRIDIRKSILAYTKNVIDDEWGSKNTKIPSYITIKSLEDIWTAYYAVEPTNKKQEIWYTESISNLNQLMGARLSRLMGSEESLGSEMWTFLIVGGVIVAGFIGFFWIESLTSHLLLASVLAASIAFLLFLIYSLDTVFSGGLNVPPLALERVLKFFTYN